jgi:hypothetical protein
VRTPKHCPLTTASRPRRCTALQIGYQLAVLRGYQLACYASKAQFALIDIFCFFEK